MSQELKFTACTHLDFDDNYGNCKKELVNVGETKVFWMREVSDIAMPSMVQFCKLRGRLNNPDACVCEENKRCSKYEDKIHSVVIEE